eukprot:gnl/Hemi2/27147_TR9123_c0_g1_i1.p1 gnl/Hemi2/27147_TR9123_c0_g1~~gnl/Hemi2/27147_TR9123_c0_g1_i1.p1  ORF type:complete len:785 (-),score=131.32 gnl/Hemi2/27147_TR9123_c0_g1_i1:704-3058(-)
MGAPRGAWAGALLLGLFVFAKLWLTVAGAVIAVDDPSCVSERGCLSVQGAIDRAAEGDTIEIQGSLWPYPCGNVITGKSISFVGVGALPVFFDCKHASQAFSFVQSNANLTNISIVNGQCGLWEAGSAVSVLNGSLAMHHCQFRSSRDSEGGTGGAVSVSLSDGGASAVLFEDCEFSNCSGFDGGAVSLFTTGAVAPLATFRRCIFFNTTGGFSGGAVYSMGNFRLEFYHCSFSENLAASGRAAFLSSPAFVRFDGCHFSGNSATTAGAVDVTSGREVSDLVLAVEIVNCTFEGNRARESGGALSVAATSLTKLSLFVADSVFTRNAVSWDGTPYGSGAAVCFSTLSAEAEHSVVFVNCSFLANVAKAQGGAVFLQFFPDAELNSPYGGWMYNNTVVFRDSLFANNLCSHINTSSVGHLGGAIWAGNALTSIENTDFINNTAKTAGGACYWGGATGSLTLTNTRFQGNRAPQGSDLTMVDRGSLSLGSGTTFLASQPQTSFLTVTQASSFELRAPSRLSCPVGTQLVDTGLGEVPVPPKVWHGFIRLLTARSLDFTCVPCELGEYSLETSTKFNDTVTVIHCQPCVYGTNCTVRGVLAHLPGFWCETVAQSPARRGARACCAAAVWQATRPRLASPVCPWSSALARTGSHLLWSLWRPCGSACSSTLRSLPCWWRLRSTLPTLCRCCCPRTPTRWWRTCSGLCGASRRRHTSSTLGRRWTPACFQAGAQWKSRFSASHSRRCCLGSWARWQACGGWWRRCLQAVAVRASGAEWQTTMRPPCWLC